MASEPTPPAPTILDRASFLSPAKRRFKYVALPDGRTVRIRNLTEAERSSFEGSILTSKGDFSLSKIKLQRRRLICLCLVDDEGNRLLTDADADSAAFREMDGAVTGVLYDECRKWCGFDEGDLDELVKNSGQITG